MSLFNELKRRNVFKVGIAYVVVAWLVAQVLQLVFESFGTPIWVMKTVLVLLATGMPFALFFAWAFEMTPEGLKREHEVDRSQSITPETGKKLNLVITGVMALALAYFAYDKFVLSTSRETAAIESAVEEATSRALTEQAVSVETSSEPDNSIAVLPFVNMSSDAEQEYFSDGLSEELLNLLAKIPELRVAARTSSFSFKGQNLEIPDIAKRLQVAHILEGSVRKAGNQVRITAQLIKADDGFHLWSETYDRSLDNIFAIQDEIATEVVSQLKLTLLGAVPTVSEIDPQAYALFLHGRQMSREFTPESLERGNELYKEALAIDPDYAEAWGQLSRNYINQTGNGLLPMDEGLSLARQAINKSLAINPDSAVGVAQNGFIAMTYDNDLKTAVRLYERAQSLEPSDLDIIRNLATLAESLGRLDEAILLGEYITARDPVNPMGHTGLGDIYRSAGRLDDALASYNFALSLSPDRIGGQYNVATILLLQGQAEQALDAFLKEGDEEYRVKGIALASLELGRESEYQAALAELQQRWGERWPIDVAEVYARAGDADNAFAWLERALESSDGLSSLGQNPFMTSLYGDPRWHDLLKRAGHAPGQLAAIEFKVKLPK